MTHLVVALKNPLITLLWRKTTEAVVVPLNAHWSDVGSWSALWEISRKDKSGNAIRGDVLIHDSSDSYLYSQHRLIGVVGVKDLVVVETKDAILVAHKDKVQQVKNIVEKLKVNNRTEYLQHREIFRPWGSHDSIAEGSRFEVKHVVIHPDIKLLNRFITIVLSIGLLFLEQQKSIMKMKYFLFLKMNQLIYQ